MEYNILKVVPGLQATTLVVHNIPKKFPVKPSKKMGMKKPVKRIVKRGTETLVGIGLLRATSSMIK